MIGPLTAAGIQLNGHRMTRRLLRQWTEEGRPHTVAIHTLGGIYTSKGDGVYASTEQAFNSVEEFWRYIGRYYQGRALMWESH